MSLITQESREASCASTTSPTPHASCGRIFGARRPTRPEQMLQQQLIGASVADSYLSKAIVLDVKTNNS
jgi:hypothetical protein